MKSATSTSADSYGTVRRSKDLEERKPVTEPQHLQSKDLLGELIQQLQSDCLNRELEETLEGVCNQCRHKSASAVYGRHPSFSILLPSSISLLFCLCLLSLLCFAAF